MESLLISIGVVAQGAAITGPCYSFHWKRPSEVFDFEVGFPVNQPIVPEGRVAPSRLPAGPIVRAIYRGGYEGLGAAWGEFCAWIDAQKLPVQDSLWERYIAGPESGSDARQWCTELNRPLKA